jgi:hypothetical protein
MDSFWTAADERQKADVYPYLIRSLLKKPKELSRRMPFSLLFPADYSETLEIDLPENWKSATEHTTVHSAVFDAESDYTTLGRRMIVRYTFKTKKDFVGQDEAEAFYRDYNKVMDEFGYTLRTRTAGTTALAEDRPLQQEKSVLPSLLRRTLASTFALLIIVAFGLAFRKLVSKNF